MSRETSDNTSEYTAARVHSRMYADRVINYAIKVRESVNAFGFHAFKCGRLRGLTEAFLIRYISFI